jgi:hypothetical protein
MLRKLILTLAAAAALGTAMYANPAYAYKVGDCLTGDRLMASGQWVHDKTCPQKNKKPDGTNTPR